MMKVNLFRDYFPFISSFVTYLLATKTSFFGKKFKPKWDELYTNEDTIFIAQLICKHVSIFHCNDYRITQVKNLVSKKNNNYSIYNSFECLKFEYLKNYFDKLYTSRIRILSSDMFYQFSV